VLDFFDGFAIRFSDCLSIADLMMLPGYRFDLGFYPRTRILKGVVMSGVVFDD